MPWGFPYLKWWWKIPKKSPDCRASPISAMTRRETPGRPVGVDDITLHGAQQQGWPWKCYFWWLRNHHCKDGWDILKPYKQWDKPWETTSQLGPRISMDLFHLRYSYDPEDIEKINPQHIRRITADQYTVRGSVTCNHQYDNQSAVVLLMAQVKCQHFFLDFMMTQLEGNDFPFPILTMSSWYMWLPTCCIKLDRTGW